MKIRLLIAADHPIFAEAVSFWLGQEEDIDIVGQAENGQVAVDLARQLAPDVILMDAMMSKMSGIEATHSIVEEMPEIKVIILSEAVHSRCMSEALAAGASGFIARSSLPQELLLAIHDVASGGSYLTPAASSAIVDHYLHSGDIAPTRRVGLTFRQRHILRLIAEGQTIKQIAQQLSLSPKTVDWHRGQIMKKLDIDTTAGLVRYAIVEGLTSADLLPLAMR